MSDAKLVVEARVYSRVLARQIMEWHESPDPTKREWLDKNDEVVARIGSWNPFASREDDEQICNAAVAMFGEAKVNRFLERSFRPVNQGEPGYYAYALLYEAEKLDRAGT